MKRTSKKITVIVVVFTFCYRADICETFSCLGLVLHEVISRRMSSLFLERIGIFSLTFVKVIDILQGDLRFSRWNSQGEI